MSHPEKDKINATIRHLFVHYFSAITFLILLALLILFRLLPFRQESQPVNVTLERYLIMVTLIAIPASLKWFAHRLKKSDRPMLMEDARNQYRRIYYVRHYTLAMVTLFHICLYGISRNTNFFWFTVVLLIIFLFCRPSPVELESLMEEPSKKDDREKETQDSDDTSIGE